jgi:carbon-monoxide dehydrogenase medium subunit
MKPAPIGYARATSVAHALSMLADGGDDVRILAGGQSLIASLNLRLIESPNLIDINHLDDLRGIRDEGDHIRIGALTRHCELATSDILSKHVPILAQASPLIAHAAIRTRGTIGGSLANADAAAELPACAVALDATLVLESQAGGGRKVKADDFFLGLFETARRPDELLVAVEVPKIRPGDRQAIVELARRSGDYALAGLAAAGPVAAPRLVFFGVGDAPVKARAAMAVVERGGTPEEAGQALATDLDPPSDLHGSAAYRLHIARVLLRRVLGAAARSEEAA